MLEWTTSSISIYPVRRLSKQHDTCAQPHTLHSGRPPFQVAYSYSNQLSGRDKLEDQEVFNSIQTTSRIQLRTSQPGHHQYHLSHVGDAAYPLPAPRERSKRSPRYSGTVLKQEVLPRPSVYFKSAGPASYCLNEALVPRPGHYDDPTVVLVGKAPFKLTLSIKNVATSETRTAVVDVLTNEWKVEVPTYSLQTVGPHQITIESFQDSSSCSPSPVDPELRTFAIEVAETAAIVPFDRRQDWCVGDVLQFQLEGNAPWRIEYVFGTPYVSAPRLIRTQFMKLPLQWKGHLCDVQDPQVQQSCREGWPIRNYRRCASASFMPKLRL